MQYYVPKPVGALLLISLAVLLIAVGAVSWLIAPMKIKSEGPFLYDYAQIYKGRFTLHLLSLPGPARFEERIWSRHLIFEYGPSILADKAALFVSVVLWYPAGLLLVPPAVLLTCRWVRRAVRAKGGFCQSCGYNLRGLDSSRCPECGTAPMQVTRGGRQQ